MLEAPVKVAVPERFRAAIGEVPPPPHEFAWYSDADSAVAVVGDCVAMWSALPVADVERVLAAGHLLRWLSIINAGVDGWPLHLLADRGIVLTNGAGLHAIPMAEYAVMGILGLVKRFPDLVRGQDRREWINTGANRELFGKRVLIFGYGQVGREIGRRLESFGMQVVGVRRRPGDEAGVIAGDGWRQELPEADVVVVAAPLTGATQAVIGAEELRAMKASALLVNVARGGLVDEVALAAALRDDAIGGAYLDVTGVEPLPADSPLWALPNVIISPHSSASSSQFEPRAVALFRDNLERFAAGAPLRNTVDFAAGY
ncbi:MAG: D-2-hydroxyacid dehydrogenase [Candidatus Dormibacteraceae bacterium]